MSVEVRVSSWNARRSRGLVSINKVSPCEITSWLDGSIEFIWGGKGEKKEEKSLCYLSCIHLTYNFAYIITFHIESKPDDRIRHGWWFNQIHHARQLAIDRHTTLEAHLRAFRHYFPNSNVMSSDRIDDDARTVARALTQDWLQNTGNESFVTRDFPSEYVYFLTVVECALMVSTHLGGKEDSWVLASNNSPKKDLSRLLWRDITTYISCSFFVVPRVQHH